MMIKVEAYVREDKFEDVKAALNAIGVNALTVSQVMGCGIQRGYKEIVRGMQVDMQMQPKIKFEIVVSSEEWEVKTIEAIEKAAYTGEPGDTSAFFDKLGSWINDSSIVLYAADIDHDPDLIYSTDDNRINPANYLADKAKQPQ